MILGRPEADEYPAFASAYIAHVPGDDPVQLLEEQIVRTVALLQPLGESQASHRYATGKWSIKETVCHLSDAERIISTRLLRIGRADETPQPGFDQDAYVPVCGAEERTLQSLLEEFKSVRNSTLALLKGLPQVAWLRKGTVSSYTCTARGLAFVTAGHELHHFLLLKERYLPALTGTA